MAATIVLRLSVGSKEMRLSLCIYNKDILSTKTIICL